MDSLTHIVVGASIGEAMLGKKIGKRAMLLGAIAQSIPDIDFFAAAWCSPADNLLAHRGFTHSILFVLMLAPCFAWMAERLHRPHNILFRRWLVFMLANLFLHIFMDAFNVYGVGWFEPFDHARISFNSLYVADPFFSIWPGIAFIALLIIPAKKISRLKWARLGMILPALYLLWGFVNKLYIDKEVKELSADKGIVSNRIFSTPSPMNIFLWYVAIETDSGYHVGYRSVFDKEKNFKEHYFEKNDFLLKPFEGSNDLRQLRRFSQGYYTAERWHDTLVFNDLRFGQEIGWARPEAHFVFHFYLNRPGENKLVMQRGRFSGWNREAMFALIRRIGGR